MSRLDPGFKFIRSFISGYLEVLISTGLIDINGKTNQQIHDEMLLKLKDIVQKKEYFVSLDYSNDLIKEARKYNRKQKYEMSQLFYATWFEHWINKVIYTSGLKKGLSEKDIITLIRELKVQTKYTVIPKMMDIEPIDSVICKTISLVSESRNAFVHYKHVPKNVNEVAIDREKSLKTVSDVEKAVAYLSGYYAKKINGITYKRIREIIEYENTKT